jgi:iron complex outermembrane receptor protein
MYSREQGQPGLPRQTAIALVVSALCMGAVGLHAQTLDSVVISASRSEQRSFDASAAISSVDREAIQDAGPQVNLSETLNRVPGLTILNRQNYAQDLQVSIRGFGARTAFGIRGIRLLIDGIPATTPDGQGQGSSISLPSTERIEVLRGPLAQLYGNSAGGVIQAFTREAPETPEFMYQYYAGSYGMHRNDWQYAGKNGAVGIVADYSTFDTNGYRDNSATQRKQFNGKLSFGPDEKTRVNVVFNQFDMPLAQDPLGLTSTQMLANAQQAGLGTNNRNASDFRVRKTVLQNQAGATLSHQLDANRSINTRVYYGTRDNLQFQAGSGTSSSQNYDGSWVGLNRAYYGLGVQLNSSTTFGQTPVKFVTGYEFDRSREYRQGGPAINGEKNGSPTRREDNQAESSDLFAQATALISPQWSVVGGARYSTVRFVSDDYYIVTGSNSDGSGNVTYSAFNPVLGATYHATDTLNIYANYGRGFETPTLAEVAYIDGSNGSTTPDTAFNPNVKASYSQHYELGLKWLPSRSHRFDATLFQTETKDEIVVSQNASGRISYKNASGTTRTGLELSSYNLLSNHWRGNVALSWIDAVYANGNKLPGIPQHFLFSELVWSSQAAPAPKVRTLGTTAGVEMISAGRLYAKDDNTASADGYTVLNLKASHAWQVGKGRVTTYARVDNVTDQKYVGSVIVNQSSNQFFEPAPGVNYTVGLSLMVPL